MRQIPYSKYIVFCREYHAGHFFSQRFGQAFMNHFQFYENTGIFDTIWNTEWTYEAKDLIDNNLIDWEN